MLSLLVLLPRWLPSDLAGTSAIAGALAASDSAPSGPADLVQYGALGIVASAAIFGLTWFVRVMRLEHQEALNRERENVDRIQQRLDEARAELKAVRAEWAAEVREMNRTQVEKVIPALLTSAEMTKEAMFLIRDANRRGQR